MSETTVVIKTIGRKTLKGAMRSAKREGFKSIVVSDGVRVSAQGAYKYIKLGKQWGYYGGMAANVGAALTETEFITFLDDDDEFAPGAGDIIRKKLKEEPSVDIWVGGIRMQGEVDIYDTGQGWEQQCTDDPRVWAPVRKVSEATGKVIFSSTELGVRPELGPVAGNVCMPTYRTSIFAKEPFKDCLTEQHAAMADYWHVAHCLQHGYSIDWFGDVIYLVRPVAGGYNGEGK